jgi:hypothetical protein
LDDGRGADRLVLDLGSGEPAAGKNESPENAPIQGAEK